MKALVLIVFAIFYIVSNAFSMRFEMVYSEPLAVYLFVSKLQQRNDLYSANRFEGSEYNAEKYQKLLTKFSEIQKDYTFFLNEEMKSFHFPYSTESQLRKNLADASSIDDFANRSVGIIPTKDLTTLCSVLREFVPVYRNLIFEPNKIWFNDQVERIKEAGINTDLESHYKSASVFYGSSHDTSIVFKIAFYPQPESKGFSASAFTNIGICGVTNKLTDIPTYLSVMMHEIFHILYDEQPDELKEKIYNYFRKSVDSSSIYAYHLMNEGLATALGNGYVYEKVNGSVDTTEWYNIKYIEKISHAIYPTVKEYLVKGKTIDSVFVSRYIKAYVSDSSKWKNELPHIMSYRYVLSTNREDFDTINNLYPNTSMFVSEDVIDRETVKAMSESNLTKMIILSDDPDQQICYLKSYFPELRPLTFNTTVDFAQRIELSDKTVLILLNRKNNSLSALLNNLK